MSDSPFPGLRPFRRDEFGIFFGREEQIDQLLEKLEGRRFLGVVGASGGGKSSLVRAGLIPALETGFMASAGARWRVAQMRPGDRPLRRLAEALLEEAALGRELGAEPAAVALLHSALRRGPLGLAEVLRDAALPEHVNVLLVVDQFEEIFRYHALGDSEEAEAFVAQLLATFRAEDLPVYVVITMRSDFIGDCALFNGLPEALNDSQFLTPRLTREQRTACIVGPAGVFGGKVEPALVTRLLNDMGEDPDQLPLLQHLLRRMWTEAERAAGAAGGPITLTLAGYHAAGGIADALSRHADEAFSELDEPRRAVAERTFRCLTDRGGGRRDTRRPVRLAEAAAVAEAEPEEVAAVAEVFRARGRSFLKPGPGVELRPDSVLDISHESLIRQWRRLEGWVEDEARSAQLYRRLLQTARLWKASEAGLWGTPDLDLALAWRKRERPTAAWAERYGGDFALTMEFLTESLRKRREEREAERRAREEAARQQRVRQRSVLLAAALAVALLLTGLAVWQWIEADRQRDRARAGEVMAQAREMADSYPQRSLLLAVRALDLSERAGRHGKAVIQTLQEALTNVGGDALVGRYGGLRTALVTPDGTLVAAGDDAVVRVWSLDEPDVPPRELHGHREAVTAGAVSADGRYLATGSLDQTVRLWDLEAESADADGRALPAAGSGVTSVAFSPDGRWLAAGVQERLALLWELASEPLGEPLRLEGHADWVNAVLVDPGGRWVISASEDNTARLWSLGASDPAQDPVVLSGHRGPIRCLAVSPDGRWLATGSEDNTARLWDLSAPSPAVAVLELLGHESSLEVVAFSVDGRRLVTGSTDETARLWDLELLPGGEPRVLEAHTASLTSVAVGADGRWLVTGSLDKTARLWNLQSDDPAAASKVLRGHDAALTALAISPDGRWLATASLDGTARRWDLERPVGIKPAVVLPGHVDSVGALAVSRDGRLLVTASADNTVRLWEMTSPDPAFHPTVLRGHQSPVDVVALGPEGRWLASGSQDNTARLWDLRAEEPGARPAVLRGHASSVIALAFDPEGRWLASGGREGAIRVWNLQADDPAAAPRLLDGHTDAVKALVVSPDGSRLASGAGDGSVRIWSLAGPRAEPQAELPVDHRRPVSDLAITPDGSRLLTASLDGTARLLDLADPSAPPTVLAGHRRAINDLELSPDGRWLATASSDGTARLWDLAAAAPTPATHVLRGHQDAVLSLAFSDDGHWLLTGGADRLALLWDLHADDPAAAPGILRGHLDEVLAVAVSPGRRWLVTGSRDDTARLWDGSLWTQSPEKLRELACARAGRDLTPEEWGRYLEGRFRPICQPRQAPSPASSEPEQLF